MGRVTEPGFGTMVNLTLWSSLGGFAANCRLTIKGLGPAVWPVTATDPTAGESGTIGLVMSGERFSDPALNRGEAGKTEAESRRPTRTAMAKNFKTDCIYPIYL